MISIHILYLILPNVFCLGYRLSGIKSKKNNVHFSKRKHIEHTNAVPIKVKRVGYMIHNTYYVVGFRFNIFKY